jgi:hypothetical protein
MDDIRMSLSLEITNTIILVLGFTPETVYVLSFTSGGYNRVVELLDGQYHLSFI